MLEQLKTNTNVIKIIKFGSVVYRTETPKSDVDYIVIVTDDYELVDRQIKTDMEDFSFYRESEWLKMIDDCDVRCLETESSSIYEYVKGSPYYCYVSLDYDKVRSSISKTSSNSWVKCKKKYTVEKDYDPYKAKKSLFHSLRILMFGIQIMKYGMIKDFKEANYLHKEIIEDNWNDDKSWEYFKERYQPLYNKLKTQFKLEHKKKCNHLI